MPTFKSAETGTDFKGAETANTNYQLNASKIYYQIKEGTLISNSVLIDSYQVPRPLRHGHGPQLLLFALNLAPIFLY